MSTTEETIQTTYVPTIFKRAVTNILAANKLTYVDLCDAMWVDYSTFARWFNVLGDIPDWGIKKIETHMAQLCKIDKSQLYNAKYSMWEDRRLFLHAIDQVMNRDINFTEASMITILKDEERVRYLLHGTKPNTRLAYKEQEYIPYDKEQLVIKSVNAPKLQSINKTLIQKECKCNSKETPTNTTGPQQSQNIAPMNAESQTSKEEWDTDITLKVTVKSPESNQIIIKAMQHNMTIGQFCAKLIKDALSANA